MSGWLIGAAFLATCLAVAAVLVLQEVRYQAVRDDRFDVMGDDDE